MRQDVEEHCRTCFICQTSKPTKREKADMISIGTGFPSQRLGIDIIDFPKSRSGFKHALTMIDYFTRYAEVIPIRDTKSATVAKVIFNEWISRYGAPHVIHSDQGSNLDGNKIVIELCALFDIDKTRTTPFRPQCNGATERIHRTLTTMLKCFLSSKDDWDQLLPGCLLAYRCSINASTKYSPFELLFGRPMTLPIDLLFSSPNTETLNSPKTYVESLRSQLDNVFAVAHNNLQTAQSTNRRTYATINKTVKLNFHRGELV